MDFLGEMQPFEDHQALNRRGQGLTVAMNDGRGSLERYAVIELLRHFDASLARDGRVQDSLSSTMSRDQLYETFPLG